MMAVITCGGCHRAYVISPSDVVEGCRRMRIGEDCAVIVAGLGVDSSQVGIAYSIGPILSRVCLRSSALCIVCTVLLNPDM